MHGYGLAEGMLLKELECEGVVMHRCLVVSAVNERSHKCMLLICFWRPPLVVTAGVEGPLNPSKGFRRRDSANGNPAHAQKVT